VGLSETHYERFPTRVLVGRQRPGVGDLLHEHLGLGLSACQRRVGSQATDDEHPLPVHALEYLRCRPRLPDAERLHRDRHPTSPARVPNEPLGHHADDGEGDPVQHRRRADHRWIPAKALLPEVVAEDQERVSHRRLRLGGAKRASEERRDAQDLEVVVGHVLDPDREWSVARKSQGVVSDARPVDLAAPLSQELQLGIGPRCPRTPEQGCEEIGRDEALGLREW